MLPDSATNNHPTFYESRNLKCLTGMDPSVKNLSIHGRIRLAEDLWDSIASDKSSIFFSSAQKAELYKRPEAYKVIKTRDTPLTKLFRKSAKNCESRIRFCKKTDLADAASLHQRSYRMLDVIDKKTFFDKVKIWLK